MGCNIGNGAIFQKMQIKQDYFVLMVGKIKDYCFLMLVITWESNFHMLFVANW